jgi:hypothetical protein
VLYVYPSKNSGFRLRDSSQSKRKKEKKTKTKQVEGLRAIDQKKKKKK